MPHSWFAYLPPHLASDLSAHPQVSPLERVLREQAVALFADISGFTPMSEALGQIGPKGTEELSHILNRTFGEMIEIIHTYGGSIGKFAGDALTVVFPFRPHHQRVTIRRAVQCALDMQAAMSRIAVCPTNAGIFHLTMKIGLGMGSLLTITVGDPATRLEYLIAGSAIDRCAAAEHHTPKGAVVVPDDLLPSLNIHTAIPIAPGYSQIMQLQRRTQKAPRAVAPAAPARETFIHYLPPSIAERLVQQQQGLVDEHRTVTTLFVRFTGFDYQDPQVVERLQSYFGTIVRISNRYGGYLRQVDVGDKGSLYIILFGAPSAHEDDAERAGLCALDIQAASSHVGIPIAVGITTGRIYCGLVGSHLRREYAAIGDSVNLAARLMAAASPNQILADIQTYQQLRTAFQWSELLPISVKGKRQPIAIFALAQRLQRSSNRLHAPGYSLPMVGRETELADCLQCLNQMSSKPGQIIGITAEAGMGKSRLIAEILRSPASKVTRSIISECLSYGTNSSYLVWHHALRNLFEISAHTPLDEQIEQVRRTLNAINPNLVQRMPLLGSALQLPIPENEFTRSLEAELRKLGLENLVITCLRAWAKAQPLLLILEDCHWIDPLSDDLLFALAQRMSDVPLLVLITYRPLQTEHTSITTPILRVRMLPRYREFALTAFTPEETTQLIALKMTRLFGFSSQVPAWLLNHINERAQGNPFYIDELLNLLHDRGVDIHDSQVPADHELPDTLQRLILSRIDRLPEGPKAALKHASIMGRLFKASWLWQIDPLLGGKEIVQSHLTQLQHHDFTQLERAQPELEYLFKHIITRDVAYESLTYTTRATLHEQVALFIERSYANELTDWLDVLAYHYANSTNIPKQCEYFRRAGDAAKTAYANTAALHYYQRLLELLPEAEHGEILLALSQVERHIGQWQAAEQHARAALELAQVQQQHKLYGEAVTILSEVLRYTGRLNDAFALLKGAYEALKVLHEPAGLLAILGELGSVWHWLGDLDEMLISQEEYLALATAQQSYTHICHAHNNIAVVFMRKEQLAKAIYHCEQGIDVAAAHHLQKQLCILLSNLGSIYAIKGEAYRSIELYLRELDGAIQMGHQDLMVHALRNISSMYYKVGKHWEAIQCACAALALMGEKLSPYWTESILIELPTMVQQIGAAEQAAALSERGVRLVRMTKAPIHLAHLLHTHAILATEHQQYATALASATEAAMLLAELNLATHALEAQLLMIRLHVYLDYQTREQAIMQLHALRQTWMDPLQQANVAYTIWQIDPNQEEERRSAAEQYRAAYLAQFEHLYRERYRELTGEDLPDPPPFPAPPPIVAEYQIDIDEFVARVDQLLLTYESIHPPG